MIVDVDETCGSQAHCIFFPILVKPAACQGEGNLHAMVPLRFGSLHAATTFGAVGANVLNVDSCSDDLDVSQRELGSLGDDTAVHCNEGAAIVVQSISIATLLVSVQIYPSQLWIVSIKEVSSTWHFNSLSG
jgi:hypothetical protein